MRALRESEVEHHSKLKNIGQDPQKRILSNASSEDQCLKRRRKDNEDALLELSGMLVDPARRAASDSERTSEPWHNPSTL